jgi:hypothetical protein
MGSIGVERKSDTPESTGHWEDQFALERASLESESPKGPAESAGLVLFIAGLSFLLLGLFCVHDTRHNDWFVIIINIKILTNPTISNNPSDRI